MRLPILKTGKAGVAKGGKGGNLLLVRLTSAAVGDLYFHGTCLHFATLLIIFTHDTVGRCVSTNGKPPFVALFFAPPYRNGLWYWARNSRNFYRAGARLLRNMARNAVRICGQSDLAEVY